MRASLEYLGPEPSISVDSASEYIDFSIEQLGGWFQTTPFSALLCQRTDLAAGEPDVVEFFKTGGYSNSDPHVDFYRSYFDDPDLRLPPGTYRISSGLGFNLDGAGCHPNDAVPSYGVGVSIVIEVK